MNEVREIERAAARLQRSMDEAYSRHLESNDEQRVEGIASALRTAWTAFRRRCAASSWRC